MTRITTAFTTCKNQKRAALITYLMAGDPDRATTLSALESLAKNGADIIELGMPFSDPMADGPAIQAAAIRSLANHTKLKDVLAIVADFRKHHDTPLLLMGYYNPVLHYGLEAFTRDAKQAGVDGLLIVDLPPEEDTALHQAAQKTGLDFIKLVTPTTDAARLAKILPKASGFLYYVSIAGVTGTKQASTDSIEAACARFKAQTDLPIAVGFGIKTPEDVRAIAPFAEGIVVGSALVGALKEKGVDAVGMLAKALAEGL
jgi:tryptophan synthase alpha chain